MQTILFICTGNTCRSPMAEAVARHVILSGDYGEPNDILVASAGLFASDGAATSPETLRTLAEHGIEHQGRSKPLTADMVRKADVILCMTSSHMTAVLELIGDDEQARSRVGMLDAQGDIPDPIGSGQQAYDSLADHLLELIPRRLREVLSDEDRARIGSPR